MFLYTFTILTNVSLLAQNGDTLEIQRSNNSIRFARLKPDKTGKRTMQNAQQVLHDVFVAGDDINFKHIKTSTDNLGITHKTFQQEFKGIPVEGAQVFVHGKNPNIEVINGDFIVLAGNPIIPEISEQSALTKALKYINAQKYKWEDSALEQFKKH